MIKDFVLCMILKIRSGLKDHYRKQNFNKGKKLKIVQVFNHYTSQFGGEVTIYKTLVDILKKNGHIVICAEKFSQDINNIIKKFSTFFSSFYSFAAKREFYSILLSNTPDLVHIHHVYPLFSPSILVACKELNIPVVMTLHNYYLTCPIGLHYTKDSICEKCLGGREYWGFLKNCSGNIGKSMNYALRTFIARRFELFKKNVSLFIVLSDFAKKRFVSAGIPESHLFKIPNGVKIPLSYSEPKMRNIIGFAGRFEAIKGVDTVISLGAALPKIPIEIAGDGPLKKKLEASASRNISFLGRLDICQMSEFYDRCKCVLFPTKVFEGCPMIVLEAMAHGVPVVAPRIGSLCEIIEDGVNGFLCDYNDTDGFIQKVKNVWDNSDLCSQAGKAARAKAVREYSEEIFYQRVLSAYQRAKRINFNC